MEHLVDEFVKQCLINSRYNIEQIYNAMMETLTNDEATFMADNFQLFIEAGKSARNSIPEVQSVLMQN